VIYGTWLLSIELLCDSELSSTIDCFHFAPALLEIIYYQSMWEPRSAQHVRGYLEAQIHAVGFVASGADPQSSSESVQTADKLGPVYQQILDAMEPTNSILTTT